MSAILAIVGVPNAPDLAVGVITGLAGAVAAFLVGVVALLRVLPSSLAEGVVLPDDMPERSLLLLRVRQALNSRKQ